MQGHPTGFWGKLRRADDGSVSEWHPLVHHCLDVACCAEALLTRTVLGPRLARLVGQACLSPRTVARLSVVAALHDLGKFTHGFQAKATATHARGTGGHVGPGAAAVRPLDPCSTIWADDALGELLGWVEDSEAMQGLMLASVGHHGRPAPRNAEHGDWRPSRERDPLAGVRALMLSCRATFPAAFECCQERLPGAAEFQHAFAGLVMLADWLGSDADRWFPYSASEHDDHGPIARRQAEVAVAAIGLDVGRLRQGAPVGWSAILPPMAEPRALQLVAAALDTAGVGVVDIFEAETGAGKTEAALARFAALFAVGAVDALYFALPTRTAASQLHGRIQGAADRLWGEGAVEVVLAVPGYLQAGKNVGQQLPGYRVLWPDDPAAGREGRRWAAEGPKRFLCATIAVGTIDQVLLAGLEVNHAHLRTTALMRSLLVVDEVHASDAYMTAILRRVLQFHVSAGGRALLLSATLGHAMRASLVEPRRRPVSCSLDQAVSVPFPAVHVGAQVTAVASDGRHKVVEMELLAAAEDAVEVARVAVAAARAGAHVLVIRNRVADAIATQRAVETAVGDDLDILMRVGGVPAPHHSRFATVDRQALDASIERDFGKGRPVQGKIAVATQTVQQSLDLDADLLITDLCPVDVLLQRIGRLHRHEGPRPGGFEGARCVVLGPGVDDLGTWLDARGRVQRRVAGLGSVYEDLRAAQACMELIRQRPTWEIPAMNRELVERGTHAEAMEAISNRSQAWTAHAVSTLGAKLAQSGQARTVLWAYEDPIGDCQFASKELEGKIKTRIGADDRVFVLEPGFRSAFGGSVERIQVPGWLARGVAPDVEVADVEVTDRGRVRIDVAGLKLRYDRLGLRPDGDDGDQEDLDG